MSDHDEHDDVPMCDDCSNAVDDCDCEWSEVYSEHSTFSSFCPEGNKQLKPYADWYYFQCWGGGPEGGYIMNRETLEVCRVNRGWFEPFSVEPCEGQTIEYEYRNNVPMLRLVPLRR